MVVQEEVVQEEIVQEEVAMEGYLQDSPIQEQKEEPPDILAQERDIQEKVVHGMIVQGEVVLEEVIQEEIVQEEAVQEKSPDAPVQEGNIQEEVFQEEVVPLRTTVTAKCRCKSPLFYYTPQIVVKVPYCIYTHLSFVPRIPRGLRLLPRGAHGPRSSLRATKVKNAARDFITTPVNANPRDRHSSLARVASMEHRSIPLLRGALRRACRASSARSSTSTSPKYQRMITKSCFYE